MSGEAKSSPAVPIIVAVIGVVGSVIVAYMTTQAKFNTELGAKEADITRLKLDLMATEQRLREQQRELDKKVAAVDERLKKLDRQIEVAQVLVEKMAKYGGKAWTAMLGEREKAGGAK